ncbi:MULTISPECIES: glycosyltransferase [unclassified Bacillus (in: firmicutes)]|uniref:glycosyltransferase family 2 protein n=1 Tax=unclassified Bacillus (in: firmicutes) TaxID=185979 RepID=UPI0008E71511|nr:MULTISPECIES: glycosyltransferase [unclassified Bacillus (in: firmicutes)]SFJ09297.1 Glycosyl transferase family 2 [Bacillus sp. 71mf]SFS67220.1 Glycosyl transferase family 2 [Bacillus sp. 103mf]
MKFSVVMSVYNGEEYLTESIDSILNQTYPDFECIIVNDGSTDQTRQILDSVDDNRIRVYHLEKNYGLSYGLNFGISMAKGEWIVRQDADDISLPQRIEKQARFIQSNPGCIGVSSFIRCISAKAPIPSQLLCDIEGTNRVRTREQMMEHRFLAPPFIHGSVTFSKKVFDQIGGYNVRYAICQDHDLWIRMLEVGDIPKLEEVMYEYRVNPESLCHRDEAATCREVMEICAFHIQSWLSRQLDRQAKVLVVGSESACRYLEHHILPFTGLQVQRYVTQELIRKMPEVFNHYKKGNVDAIVILDCPEASYVQEFLQQSGMQMSRNVFKIWTVF